MQSERSRKIGYSRHASRVFLRRDFAALPDVLRSRDFASLNNDNDNDTGYGCGTRLDSLTKALRHEGRKWEIGQNSKRPMIELMEGVSPMFHDSLSPSAFVSGGRPGFNLHIRLDEARSRFGRGKETTVVVPLR